MAIKTIPTTVEELFPKEVCQFLDQANSGKSVTDPDELERLLSRAEAELHFIRDKLDSLQSVVERQESLVNQLRYNQKLFKIARHKIGETIGWEAQTYRGSSSPYFIFRTGLITEIKLVEYREYASGSSTRIESVRYTVESSSGRHYLDPNKVRVMTVKELEVSKKEYLDAIELSRNSVKKRNSSSNRERNSK